MACHRPPFAFDVRRAAAGCVAIVATLSAAFAIAEPPVAAIDFSRDIQPILSQNCFHCHGPDEATREAELRLDLREGLFRSRDGVTVVAPGDVAASELISRVASDDETLVMPPLDSNRSLSAKETALLTEWVTQGADWKRHWSFEPPRRPLLPATARRDWGANPIDAFILARLESENLSPSDAASKETLIRRVTLDLTGLPPTLAEIDAFLADDSADAFERVVDRLLATPQYGERMVWDWLDAARYADSNGFQLDLDRTMWPWRDWVVNALNDNMPFDQFTVEQLAGDLLPNATLEQIVATGFNRNHMYNAEGGRLAEETRVENVVDRVDTMATTWLGLTIGCARCHDHKYDPISQADYYGLYAFFNNCSEIGASGTGRNGQVLPVVEYSTPADHERLAQADEEVAAAERAVAKAAAILATRQKQATAIAARGERADAPGDDEEIAPADRIAAADGEATPPKAFFEFPDDRTGSELDRLLAAIDDYQSAVAEWKAAVDRRAKVDHAVPRIMVMDEMPAPRATFVLTRGAYDKYGQPVTPGVPQSLTASRFGEGASRLDLALWIVSPDNPLTSRVAVNRAWQLFFGQGLVKTAEDFGAQGEKPSHPELLDWLAVEFAGDWDVKRLHRLIVTSATYKQSSKRRPELDERDPENVLLARGARYRLPSFLLRDQALAASGLLVKKVGGPPVRPYQPEGIWEEATFNRSLYVQDHGESLYRRSLYTFWRRIVGPTMLFDNAARQACSVRVYRTNTPLHALVTLNDVTYVEAARALAERVLLAQPDDDRARIEMAFRLLTARRPTADEMEILASRLDALSAEYAADVTAAEKLLAAGESPRDERLTSSCHAAHTALCLLMLNLDESLSKE